jgi:hypothetical protein
VLICLPKGHCHPPRAPTYEKCCLGLCPPAFSILHVALCLLFFSVSGLLRAALGLWSSVFVLLVFGRWSVVIGHWSLVCWSVALSRWSLALGRWLFVWCLSSLVFCLLSLVIGPWCLVVCHWSLVFCFCDRSCFCVCVCFCV